MRTLGNRNIAKQQNKNSLYGKNCPVLTKSHSRVYKKTLSQNAAKFTV